MTWLHQFLLQLACFAPLGLMAVVAVYLALRKGPRDDQ